MTSDLRPTLKLEGGEKTQTTWAHTREEDLHADRSIRRQQIHRQQCDKHLLTNAITLLDNFFVQFAIVALSLSVRPSSRRRLPHIC